MATKAAAGKTVEGYFAKQGDWQRASLTELRALILKNAPGATQAIKWRQAVYEVSAPCMYLRGFTKHVTIGFWRGSALPDPAGLMEGGGDRMGHVKVAAGGAIPEKPIAALVKAAAALNKKLGDPT